MRVALVSTPRSGNTWLRMLIAQLYELQQLAEHQPADVHWNDLPDRCVLQLHWHRDETFLQLMREHRFRVVTIARHPLDVLISILHFCGREPDTRRWLLGEGGNEDSIHGASPSSSAFAAYGTSARARALLAVTPEWWQQPDVASIRYEDLVHDSQSVLNQLRSELGETSASGTEALAATTLEKMRPTSTNDHFWQGSPGLWKSLLPDEVLARLAHAHAGVLSSLGYDIRRDGTVDDASAAARWTELA